VALRCVVVVVVVAVVYMPVWTWRWEKEIQRERGVSCLVLYLDDFKQRRSITTGVSADFLRISGDSFTYRNRERERE
jgi:hypothetical protein